jgi:hypothetical protein
LKLKLFIAACAYLSFMVKYMSRMALDEWPIHIVQRDRLDRQKDHPEKMLFPFE